MCCIYSALKWLLYNTVEVCVQFKYIIKVPEWDESVISARAHKICLIQDSCKGKGGDARFLNDHINVMLALWGEIQIFFSFCLFCSG
jgi:hypothetical protein